MNYLKKGINLLIFFSLLCQGSMNHIQLQANEEDRYVVGEIVESSRSVDDKPSGVIYGQAQMQYQFLLSKDGKQIQMGHGGQSGVASLSTSEGSVYCLDPERFACSSIGEQGSYDVETYQSENASQIGLIWYYGNVLHAHDSKFMDYVALTQIMIWEVLGWEAKIQSGFDNYQALAQEINTAIEKHNVMPIWRIEKSNVENPETRFNLDTLSFKLQANEYVVLVDESGVFNQFFAHWNTIPKNIKVERVAANSIKLTALANVNGVNLTYSKINPEVIGNSYLLKPNANGADCQTLLMPYVSKENSAAIEFKISSDDLPFEEKNSDATFPKFIKRDTESKEPIEGAKFTIRAAASIKEKLLRETRSCQEDDEGIETCSDWRESSVTKEIWKLNESILDTTSDKDGNLELSELASLYREKRDTYLMNEHEEIISVIEDVFPGGKFSYQEVLTASPYYNQNRNKKINFSLDVNSESQTMIENNTRQKGKIIIKKIDDDLFYINHHNPYLPQGDGEFKNAEFTITANDDIYLPWGELLYHQGDFVERIQTNEEGIAESKKLELGEYAIQETKLPLGYWYHNYQEEGHKVIVNIEYTSQDTSLQIITFDKLSLGNNSPFEEIETRVMNTQLVNQSLAYPNAIQKGHFTIKKFLEGKIDDIEIAPTMNKEVAEGIYFGVYLDSKQAYNHADKLPEEFFTSKQLDGSMKLNNERYNSEPLSLNQVHERSLYMVLRTNKEGIASTLDPQTIAWVNLSKSNTEGTSTSKATPLPFGEYTVVELNTPQGYIPISFHLSIDKVNEELSEKISNKYEYLFSSLLIENKRTLQEVVISKRDKESNEIILDHEATFKLWKWNVDEVIDASKIMSNYDEEKGEWQIGVEKLDQIDYSLGKWIKQVSKTPTGTLLLDRYQTTHGQINLPQALMSGDYLLCEIKAPTGYALNDKPISFSVIDQKHPTDINENHFIMVPLIDENGNEILDSYGEVQLIAVPLRVTIFIDALNQAQKGTITIRKLGDVFDKFLLSKHPLGYVAYKPIWMIDALAHGAIFEIYADEDIIVNRNILYKDKELVDRLKITAHGEAGSIPLPLGKYIIKEVEAKAGYATNQEIIELTLNATHQNQVVFPKFLSEVNQRLHPDIAFMKYLESNHTLTKANNVYFGLYSNELLKGEEIIKPIELEKESPIDLFEVEKVHDGYIITNYLGDESNQCWIPAQINGTDIVEIKSMAFYNKQLTRIVIPSTIKRIGSKAFANNQLTRVEFHSIKPIAFEDETVFIENPELLYFYVDEMNPLDSVRLGYAWDSPFDVLDGKSLGYHLILSEFSFNNGLARNNQELLEERSFIEADTLIEVIEVKHGVGKVESALLDGTYYLKELLTHHDYVLSEERYPFVYDEGKPVIVHQGKGIVNKLKNPIPYTPSVPRNDKIKLIIQKEFEEDQFNHEQTATFTLYNEEHKKVDEFIINKMETTVFFRELAKGKYRFIETSTGDDYVLDSIPYEFEVDNNTKEVFIYGKPLLNKLKRVNVNVSKIDKNTHLPLSGAEFALYDVQFNLLMKEISDEQGFMVFENLTCGEYYLKETKAPFGYVRDEKLITILIEGKNVLDKDRIELTVSNDIHQVYDNPETGRNLSSNKPLQISFIALSLYLLIIFLKKDA